jgi:allantoinase
MIFMNFEPTLDDAKETDVIDTRIVGATVVTKAAVSLVDIGIDNGRIVDLSVHGSPGLPSRETLDATGLVVVPGAIDAHTHFTGAHDDVIEEVRAGTIGAAAGGVTTVIEMPHSDPPATTSAAFEWKKDLFSAQSSVDFALWGGMNGRNLDELARLGEAGSVAMKGFLCSGRPDGEAGDKRGLPMIDDDALVEAMRVAADLDVVVGLHAENHAILRGRSAALRAVGRDGGRAHAAAQPEIAEIEAVARSLLLARETGSRLHIVHMSSSRTAALIDGARGGARVSVETCPQYLLLDEDDLERIGPFARCGPPIRPRTTVEALWGDVLAGRVDSIASDHCPYLPEQKNGGAGSIWDAAMGLTGIETSVPLFFASAAQRGLPLQCFAAMTATNPARIFGLDDRKGAIALGLDADLAFYAPDRPWTVRGARFRGRGTWSAFEGMHCEATVVRTMVRGATVFLDGEAHVEPGHGRYQPRRVMP